MKVGDRFNSINCGEFEVVSYNGCFNVVVRFVLTGYETKTNTSNIKSGSVKDKLHRTVLGVGFIGVGNHKSKCNGKQSKKYKAWVNMIYRCYSESSIKRNPTYANVTVCDEWHNYQLFGDWYDSVMTSDKIGWEIDKDILSVNEKQYSESNCLMIPQWLNKFIKPNHSGSEFGGVGVSYMKQRKAFRARCYNPHTKKHEHLGLFNNESDSRVAWTEEKLKHASSLKHQMDLIDERVYPNVVRIINGVFDGNPNNTSK